VRLGAPTGAPYGVVLVFRCRNCSCKGSPAPRYAPAICMPFQCQAVNLRRAALGLLPGTAGILPEVPKLGVELLAVIHDGGECCSSARVLVIQDGGEVPLPLPYLKHPPTHVPTLGFELVHQSRVYVVSPAAGRQSSTWGPATQEKRGRGGEGVVPDNCKDLGLERVALRGVGRRVLMPSTCTSSAPLDCLAAMEQVLRPGGRGPVALTGQRRSALALPASTGCQKGLCRAARWVCLPLFHRKVASLSAVCLLSRQLPVCAGLRRVSAVSVCSPLPACPSAFAFPLRYRSECLWETPGSSRLSASPSARTAAAGHPASIS